MLRECDKCRTTNAEHYIDGMCYACAEKELTTLTTANTELKARNDDLCLASSEVLKTSLTRAKEIVELKATVQRLTEEVKLDEGHINSLENEIIELKAEPWCKVEDGLPPTDKTCEEYLTYDGCNTWVNGWAYGYGNDGKKHDWMEREGEVTHWRKINPPTEPKG